MQERTLYDQPTVGMKEAAQLHMMAEARFRKRYRDCLHRYMRSVRMLRGVRLLLVDVLRSAYPEAPDDVIYSLAYRYARERHERRAKLLRRARIKREEKDA